jgi:hypothetical protein
VTSDLGDAVTLTTTVTDDEGVPTDATVTLVVTAPDGTTSSPTTTGVTTGQYTATVTPNAVGTWFYAWTASGTLTATDKGQFTVADPAPRVYGAVATLRTRMGIATDDTTWDTTLGQVLAVASRQIDNTAGRRFWLDAVATARRFNPRYRVICDDDGELLMVDDIGSETDLLVEVGSGSSWTEVSDVETDPDNALIRGWPATGLRRTDLGSWSAYRGQRVRVTAQWGWPRIPDEVVEATLIQAGRLFKRKDSPEGVMGTAEWGVIRLSRVDPDVQALLQHLVIPGIG